jgi:hypothetical protein
MVSGHIGRISGDFTDCPLSLFVKLPGEPRGSLVLDIIWNELEKKA